MAMFEHGATLNILDSHQRDPMESLCAEESVWKTGAEGGLSEDRLAVLKILVKHGRFTTSCRDLIFKWKNKRLRGTLGQQLPWRSITEMAKIAASWTIFTAIPVAVLGVAGVARFAVEWDKRLKGTG
jgi:hypothetical protein